MSLYFGNEPSNNSSLFPFRGRLIAARWMLFSDHPPFLALAHLEDPLPVRSNRALTTK